jgi:hypothetical protein
VVSRYHVELPLTQIERIVMPAGPYKSASQTRDIAPDLRHGAELAGVLVPRASSDASEVKSRVCCLMASSANNPRP